MTAAKTIEDRVDLIKSGTVFSIEDLVLPKEWWENIRVKLSRMVRNGKIQKLSKGKYYKPEQSIFGELKPNQQEIVKDLLYDENGRQIGYLTGYSVWNDMALTSQVASVIIIGTNRRRNVKKRGFYTIRFVLQPNVITQENVGLLQILDTLKEIKNIPDTTINNSIAVIKSIIKELKEAEIKELINLSDKYQPRVKALLGVILDDIGFDSMTSVLHDALNPGTKYKLGLAHCEILPDKVKWNIE